MQMRIPDQAWDSLQLLWGRCARWRGWWLRLMSTGSSGCLLRRHRNRRLHQIPLWWFGVSMPLSRSTGRHGCNRSGLRAPRNCRNWMWGLRMSRFRAMRHPPLPWVTWPRLNADWVWKAPCVSGHGWVLSPRVCQGCLRKWCGVYILSLCPSGSDPWFCGCPHHSCGRWPLNSALLPQGIYKWNSPDKEHIASSGHRCLHREEMSRQGHQSRYISGSRESYCPEPMP